MLEDVHELQEISQNEIDALVAELDYCVSKRKLLERDSPVGHLVLPIHQKFKNGTRVRALSSDVAMEWCRGMRKVIDLKSGPGTGRKTCLGGTLDDIHYIQSFLNPVYKHLDKIGVSRARIQTIYAKIDDVLQGIQDELPELFIQGDEESNSTEGDSDRELLALSTQKQKVEKGERYLWLKYKHNVSKIGGYKYDSTPFWENTGRKLFPGLCVLYYRTATKHPTEAIVERFFSAAGYITGNRRGATSMESCQAIAMRKIWGD